MSPVATQRLPLHAERPRAAPPQRAPVRARRPVEPLAVWLVAFAAYFAAGLWTTLHLDLILGDAQSRLLHAYDVFHNSPAKLTAIGFYWPPVQTLILLPFAIVKPLATSLVALPLVTAIFGGLLLVVVDRALTLAQVRRVPRLALVAAFGLNPMIVFYSVNGMAELPYLFVLALGLYLLVRWERRPHWADVPLLGVVFAVGVLSRYEVGFWVPLVALAVITTQRRRGARLEQMESSVVTLLAPVTYALLLWSFMSWTITGSPTTWLTDLIPASAPNAGPAHPLAPLTGLRIAVGEQLGLFPLTFLVVPFVYGVAVRRRSSVGVALAFALIVNLASELAILAGTRSTTYLELRYNMRGLPVAMIALAWLLAALPARRRTQAALAATAAIVLTYPVTAYTMHRSNLGQDRVFVDALLHGTKSPTRSSTLQERDFAHYIRTNIHGKDVILTDDSDTFGVVLFDGDPTRYLDRVDFGDKTWYEIRDAVLRAHRPVSPVRYLLVYRGTSLNGDQLGVAAPYLATLQGLPSWVTPVRVSHDYALYRLR